MAEEKRLYDVVEPARNMAVDIAMGEQLKGGAAPARIVDSETELIFSMINKYFEDNRYALVAHQLDSYNDFFANGVRSILKERNPIVVMKEQNEQTREYDLRCELYIGGKAGDKVYYGKPMIYDEDGARSQASYMFPNEARLRNMTYGFTIHFDVEVDFRIVDTDVIEKTILLEKIYFGRFPIMLHSNMCVLKNLEPKVCFEMGECINDNGGYFIIDGKEKVIVSQEKFANNMLYVRDNYSDLYSYSVEVKSASEDAAKPIRTTAVRMVTPTTTQSNGQLVVVIPNVRKAMPFFIVMRALGVVSDKAIIEHTLLDLEQNNEYVGLFRPSIHDAGVVFDQETALKYIATFTKGKTTAHVLQILSDLFLPHVGELNFRDKALFLGHMAFKLLKAQQQAEPVTDRDNFKYKRVELCGGLLYGLFKEYYAIMQKNVFQKIDKEYYYHVGQYQGAAFVGLIENNYLEYFKDRDVETGFRKAFKGNWGAEAHTKRPGVVQDLNRLSFNSALSQRRKINLAMDASAKVIGPRLLHGSQWGIIDPLDTPDGGNVGLHKHMAITAKITTGYSRAPFVALLKKTKLAKMLSEVAPREMAAAVSIFVNGNWVAVTEAPDRLMNLLKFMKKVAAIPIFTSISWFRTKKVIEIYTDEGRMCRPVFYVDEDQVSFFQKHAQRQIKADEFSWDDLIYGFNPKKDEGYKNNNTIFDLATLYDTDEAGGAKGLRQKQAIIEYIDSSEQDTAYIASKFRDFSKTDHTHMDIHPSLLLGVMGNQIIFPENNQLPRNLFSCGQSKQGVSLYHTNHQNRIDKMGVVLNYGQTPLVKSRYMYHINKELQPYGENCIVAIGCYGGYNVEDSILFNKGSVDRGMFRTTYYNSYESREESTKVRGTFVDSKFTNIQAENVVGLKPGYDYSALDEYGLIKENTQLNDKLTLIGKANVDLDDPNRKIDSSVYPKKGQLGFVDKAFMTEGAEGFRLAKVKIREERIPAVGDKFCSRCGQKGTIGQLIPEEDMPFTANGIKPDLIVNPHAFPSRMTIGQLVEVLTGKAGVNYGAFGDCTAFLNEGEKNEVFGRLLTDVGYNSTGNEVLYNGETGQQLDADIYIGPTYYMRLKHMVKDKINYRAQGPRTLLTRQTVQGRANDGGLRIGEMERDGLIAHGMTEFITDSMLTRGDGYYMAVCNTTGTIAIYNESQNLFLSPMADGPIKFNGEIDEKMSVINVSKYGRDFSVVKVPYTFKLLMQELGTMNIQMRLITEDNVDQLTSMAYSKNINILLNDDKITPKAILDENKQRSREGGPGPRAPQPAAPAAEAPAETAPYGAIPFDYGTTVASPAAPQGAIPFDYGTAVYQPPASPTTPPPGGLGYAPVSPSYAPVSPSYAPVSPGYAPVSPGGTMYVGEVDFAVGDKVNYAQDTNKSRVWTIVEHNDDTDDYVLQTTDVANLPAQVVLADDGAVGMTNTTKMDLVSTKPAAAPGPVTPEGPPPPPSPGPAPPLATEPILISKPADDAAETAPKSPASAEDAPTGEKTIKITKIGENE